MSLEQLTEVTMAGMGAAIAPMAYLIGFAEAADAAVLVCIKPEDGLFLQDELAVQQAGCYLAYGSFHDRLGLAPYYEQRGFTVLNRGQGMPLEPLLGLPGCLPSPDERLFLRWSWSYRLTTPSRSTSGPATRTDPEVVVTGSR